MSLCSIVYNDIKSVNIWDSSIMNRILQYGNNLYGIITQSISKDFLLLTDLPELVDIDDDTFSLEYTGWPRKKYRSLNQYNLNTKKDITLK